MKRTVLIPAWMFNKLRNYVNSTTNESAAIIGCGLSTSFNHARFMGRELIVPEPADYEIRKPGYCKVKKGWFRDSLEYCQRNQLHPITLHSHPFSENHVAESSEDLRAARHELPLIQHAFPGMATGTIVVSGGCKAVEAHVYNRLTGEREPFDMVLIPELSHLDIKLPTSSPLREFRSETEKAYWSRVALAFGEEFTRLSQHITIGIIGCGGLGEPIALQLANLGFRLALVDNDMFQAENANRSFFGNSELAKENISKVDLVVRAIRQTNPEAVVECVKGDIRYEDIQRKFTHCDILITGTDNMASRFVASHMAAAHGQILFDAGNEIDVENGRVTSIRGQVLKNIPGQNLCHHCADFFDAQEARKGLLSDDVYAFERARGYINDDIPAPSVIALNTFLAGAVALDVMRYVSGIDKENRYDLISYNMLGNTAQAHTYDRNEDHQRISCPVCSTQGYQFHGDLAPFLTKANNTDNSFFDNIEKDG